MQTDKTSLRSPGFTCQLPGFPFLKELAMEEFLEYALTYAASGWAVFPLVPNDRVPFKGSKGLKDATSDAAKIRQWWTNAPAANIGIATGKVSGLWVLDLDVKDGRDGPRRLSEFLESRKFEVDETPTKRARSASGGSHVYFKYDPARPISNRADVFGSGSGVDIRGDGGYIIAAPSVTPVGLYRWADEALSCDMAETPAWAYAVFQHDPKSPSGNHCGRSNKVDRTDRLRWDMQLHFRGNDALTLGQTDLGSKYICRCPFHDDRSASAFFKRVDVGFGFLFCSACDTTWITEARRMTRSECNDINSELARLKQKLKELT